MKHPPRLFTLTISPDGSDYVLDLTVANNGARGSVTRLEGTHLERARPSVLAAVVSSNEPRTALSPTRRRPIELSEEAGVRLALFLMASRPISKPSRVDEIRHGIDAMTPEEALYWYAKCTGPQGARSLRALRTLLAAE